jgi:hypothetical protein
MATIHPVDAILSELQTAINNQSRETIVNCLQAIDPNGCHTDGLAIDEGLDPYTLDEAIAVAQDLIADS